MEENKETKFSIFGLCPHCNNLVNMKVVVDTELKPMPKTSSKPNKKEAKANDGKGYSEGNHNPNKNMEKR